MSKMFACICFSVSTLLPNRGHPPKRLGSEGETGLNWIIQLPPPPKKKKKKRKIRGGTGSFSWHAFPSCSWEAAWAVKTPSTTVSTAPSLEMAPLGSCYPKCSSQKGSAGSAAAGPQLGVSTAGRAVQTLQSCVLLEVVAEGQWGPCARAEGSAAVVLLLPCSPQHQRGGVGSRAAPKSCAV